MIGGCVCLSAILNYHYKTANVSSIYYDITISQAGLSAPLCCDFSPYSDRPVNLALIQTQPPVTFYLPYLLCQAHMPDIKMIAISMVVLNDFRDFS